MKEIKISIKEDFIKLDSALKLANLVATGGHAKFVIQSGEVKVNGEVCLMRGKKLKLGDTAEFDGVKIIVENEGK